jgi:two-component system, NtrC family, response regulator HydG
MSNSLRVLVVDDDKDNALSMAELLEMEGHSVLAVHSGEDALEASQRENFNVSFMDVMLPGMNGVESFLRIRSLRPQARVYMMTGYSVEQLLVQALNGGALGVLEKPHDPAMILELARQVGPTGLVLAPPTLDAAGLDAGRHIHATLEQHGLRCNHVTDMRASSLQQRSNDILVIDVPVPMLEGIAFYKQVVAAGQNAPVVLVPHARGVIANPAEPLLDVRLTGVLNKPFDPMELITNLPELAA